MAKKGEDKLITLSKEWGRAFNIEPIGPDTFQNLREIGRCNGYVLADLSTFVAFMHELLVERKRHPQEARDLLQSALHEGVITDTMVQYTSQHTFVYNGNHVLTAEQLEGGLFTQSDFSRPYLSNGYCQDGEGKRVNLRRASTHDVPQETSVKNRSNLTKEKMLNVFTGSSIVERLDEIAKTQGWKKYSLAVPHQPSSKTTYPISFVIDTQANHLYIDAATPANRKGVAYQAKIL